LPESSVAKFEKIESVMSSASIVLQIEVIHIVTSIESGDRKNAWHSFWFSKNKICWRGEWDMFPLKQKGSNFCLRRDMDLFKFLKS